MKKDRNSGDRPKRDFTLPRKKILRGKRNFQRLFEKSTVLHSHSIQFRYRIYRDPSEGCFIGFIAPKKHIRSAVKRNRVKRLLREVYRTHQHYFRDLFSKQTFGFHGAFIANRDEITFHELREEMVPLLKEARSRLEAAERKNSAGRKSDDTTPDSKSNMT